MKLKNLLDLLENEIEITIDNYDNFSQTTEHIFSGPADKELTNKIAKYLNYKVILISNFIDYRIKFGRTGAVLEIEITRK